MEKACLTHLMSVRSDPAMVKVWHYDGSTAIRHEAFIEEAGSGFTLTVDGEASQTLSWSDLVAAGSRNGLPFFGHRSIKGWKIGLEAVAPADLARHLPQRQTYGKWIDRIGVGPASVAFVAISALVVLIGVKLPDLIAPLVPLSFEKKLGEAMVGDLGGRFCNGPGGQTALNIIKKRVGGNDPNIDIRVANFPLVNAVTLPGGKIIVFRGLLQEAKSSDEIAGVLSHEIGHVRHRDVMQGLLRQTGLSILLGGAGGNAGGYANAAIGLTYTRKAEEEADSYAIEALRNGRVSPEDTARFFNRLARDEEKLGAAKAAIGYVSSHPLSGDRELRFRRSMQKNANYTPVLDKDQWTALEDICHNDPNVKKDDTTLF
jgi:beta-barrel assembly-enhancing protease